MAPRNNARTIERRDSRPPGREVDGRRSCADAPRVRPVRRRPARPARAWPALLGVCLLAALALGSNLFGFPFYESDEGTYVGQALAFASQGRLAAFAYTYDHAPLGWIQLAGWAGLTGGFSTFGSAINSSRVLMLLLGVASTGLVYLVGRAVSGRVSTAILAALVFGLAPFGLYYHRRVLLDNISTFWLLVSLLLVVGRRPGPGRLVASGLALGVGALSKEVALLAAPALLFLAAAAGPPGGRLRAAAWWGVPFGLVCACYPLLALARGELLPGSATGISLLTTLAEQAGRGRDGGLLEPGSRFWAMAGRWAREEPLLVVGGTAGGLLGLSQLRRRPVWGGLGLALLPFWLFLARGGEIFPFYLLPLLPLLALNLALGVDRLIRQVAAARSAGPGFERRAGALAVGLALLGLLPGFGSPSLGFRENALTLWTNHQAAGQRQAVEWIRANLAPETRLIVDQSAWPDLQLTAYRQSYPYWKVERDPAVRDGVLRGDWRTAEVLVVTPQMRSDARDAGLPLVSAAIDHSDPLMTFDTGGWPVEVRRIRADRP